MTSLYSVDSTVSQTFPEYPYQVINNKFASTETQGYFNPSYGTSEIITEPKFQHFRGFSFGGEWNRGLTDRGMDDGIILIVGLFNLLAVVSYAGHYLFSSPTLPEKQRSIIGWQVQKVLDDLVLKVHSSKAASSLLSRAFRNSQGESTSRKIETSNIATNIINLLSNNHENKRMAIFLNNLLKELSSTKDIYRGPVLDPKIYKPVEDLYRSVMKPNKQNRALKQPLLNEIGLVIESMLKMDINQVQNILIYLTRLQKAANEPELGNILKAIVTKLHKKHLNIFPKEFNYRDPKLKRNINKRSISPASKLVNQMMSSKLIFDSTQGYQSYPVKYHEEVIFGKTAKPQPTMKSNYDHTFSPNSITSDSERNGYSKNAWFANGWFAVLTRSSPVALDLSILYTNSKKHPECLRSLLCKTNRYWKEQETFQAVLSPFLSVMASWALEGLTSHSLGDSLIALRAGWMGKRCEELYPECSIDKSPHTLVQKTMHFFAERDIDVTKQKPHTSQEENEISGNQIIETNSSNFNNQYDVRDRRTHTHIFQTTTIPTTLATKLPKPFFTIKPNISIETLLDDNELELQAPNKTLRSETTLDPHLEHMKLYDRYDNFYPEQNPYPTGSVSGMALQDWPLERINSVSPGNEISSSSRVGQAFHFNVQNEIPQTPTTLNKLAGDSSVTKKKYRSPNSSERIYYPKNQLDPSVGSNTIFRVEEKPLDSLMAIRNTVAKYKYGLRRGLPAHNVNGETPVFELKKLKLLQSHMKENKPLNFKHHRNLLNSKFISNDSLRKSLFRTIGKNL